MDPKQTKQPWPKQNKTKQNISKVGELAVLRINTWEQYGTACCWHEEKHQWKRIWGFRNEPRHTWQLIFYKNAKAIPWGKSLPFQQVVLWGLHMQVQKNETGALNHITYKMLAYNGPKIEPSEENRGVHLQELGL